ncbi:uncharacterized protein IL334_004995 [Kwoniella shivajii]|uniref:Alcohol acetyltransferase n=1 Tax=Kwoniella shivajii TaxID=564305 RepID=A0ABZ1D1X1_9TREE|nr:hypothetical protein IL334_004995 [Kwoniella shivajii]
MSDQGIEKTYCTLHERYSVARRNSGFPAIIVAVIVYPTASALPSSSSLKERIVQLQEHFPLLCSRVEDHRKTKPYFTPNASPWSPEDILSTTVYTPSSTGSKEEEYETLMNQEPRILVEKEDFWFGPAWQIRALSHPSHPDSSRAYLTLAVDHIYLDGRGLLSLLNALVADDIINLPFEKISTPTRLDDTVDIKPSLSFMLPIVIKKLLLPKFPVFIQNYFEQPPAWPSKLIRVSPTNCEPGLSIHLLPSTDVNALKTISKKHGVRTLHGLFKAAWMVSIWSVYRHTLVPFIARASTPRSERDPELGHAYCTGNYVSSHRVEISLSTKDDFWVIAKKIADELLDPKAIAQGRMNMGMLAYIPDGENESPVDVHRPTGWESFFLDEANSPEPFGESISVSNLGVTKLPEGAEDLFWGQESSPYAPPFSTSLIGHEAGMRMVTSWREGSAVIKDEAQKIEKTFGRVLQKLIAGQVDTALEKLTLDK